MSLIVIIDDRVSNRNIFAKLAASIEPEVTVRTFGEPQEALDWLSGQSPDLVITDFKMPGMDGAEFIRHFRQMPHTEDVPVIVITVYEERSFRLRALEAGATDFLHSPVDHHEFVTRARNLLKLHHHQKILAARANNLERELEASERTRETALRDSSEQLAQVIDTVPAMVCATGRDGSILFANAYQTAFAGVDPAAIIGQQPAALFGQEHGERNMSLDRMVLEQGRAIPAYEEELRDAVGALRVFLTTKSPLVDSAGEVRGVLTSSLDITARKRTEAHLRHLAHHDPLTDLPNRNLLRERMRQLTARARRGDQLFALHLIDLDGFKAVNDLLGHSAGDRYIKAVAAKLRSVIRSGDTLARLGGDEFAVLQSDVASNEDAADFAARLLGVFEEGIDFDESLNTTTASVGIAIHPTDGFDSEELMKNADLAMYRAKAESGNCYCFFASDMEMRARQQIELDARLKRAIENGEFVLYYQPQVDITTGKVVGAEALLRWDDPQFGLLTPGAFLARAEENGSIIPINEWVLERACRDAKEWQRAGVPPIRVSVNMSPIQFHKRTVPLRVAHALAESGLEPGLLDLELTESIIMRNLENVAGDLDQLLEMGVHLSIDDFGTGYSSLSYIKRLPVNQLKIDQSFVKNIDCDPNDAAIVRAITTLARSLDLETLAEGVETPEQLERVRAEGCQYVQGYYFSRPMPLADFITYAGGTGNIRQIA